MSISTWDRLMSLAAIGDTQDGGVNRQALTPGEAEAWRLLLRWAAEAGMEAATDDAANLFLTKPGRDRSLPPIMLGSHIDTQPTGGKFDGAFGVISAFNAVAALAAPPRDVTVVAWMNEEGSRFAPGMMGSEAFSGYRPIEAIRACRDAGGVTAGEAIDAHLAQFPDLPRRPFGFEVAAYIEPHIEQGPELEAAATPIGIVTGIQGKITWEIVLTGAEGHAGTLAMADRRDAVVAFARMAAEMQRLVGEADPIVKFTIGMVKVEPNAPSVVPGRVTFRIDLRHPDNAALQAAGSLLEATAERLAAPCAVQVTRLVDAPSNEFDPELRARIARAAETLGIRAMPILSAAGHDARHMAPRCPSAMIFIPCRDGISHSPLEWSTPEDVEAGAAVLAETLRSLLDEDA
ncbi:Zn-dependent hydrolase [Rhodovarius crocodyli]|uniref:Zn-dependent hydrolase n=1 Tax=Rhodovarius crocodyli TaxID=1979269 RepID=A0A437MCK6_9PROT|nr:M20 family metallo-hydrolase [Rhodovarius crocodyli]RVT95384.1 Zn-dependent hydrolase [Rhodovarius crocodyli]